VDGKLSPLTFAYTTLLTLLAAAIAGVLPGLKITRNLGHSLKRTAPGAGVTRFGGMWTAVIVVQLAVTMGFPVVTFVLRKDAARFETQRLPFPVEQYLSARLEMEQIPTDPGADTSAAGFRAAYVAAAQKLETRLESESDVTGVVFAQHLPQQYHPNHEVESRPEVSRHARCVDANGALVQHRRGQS
jgi:putative ABC transport system permease protein